MYRIMEEKVIRPFYHIHPLFLKENGNVSEEERVDCYGCGNPIADLELAYVCMQHSCSSQNNKIILHKKCGELPNRIMHPKHPDHPLNLFDSRQLQSRMCDVCRRDIVRVLGYQCSSCDFDVDIACKKIGIDALLEERKELRHPSHPHHPLTLMTKPAFAFYCDGCGAQDVDMAYICSTCAFWVHRSCASMPAILPIDQHHHHHHLSLAFSFPKEHLKYFYSYRCDVCDKYLDRTCWVYYCGDCRYFLHLKCVGSSNKPLSNSSEDDDGGGSNVIQFPLYANDISNKLITPFVMREKGVDNIPIPIPDTTTSNSFVFKYHHHPLSLVSEAAAYDELKICDVCVTPISAPPYYKCTAPNSGCNYLVHSICCFLPNTLHSSSNPNSQPYGNCQKIPDKNHKWTLYAIPKSKGADAISHWHCHLCRFPTNGMGYLCEECGMKIDVKCASLPSTIKHASHPHHKPLLLTTIPPPQQGMKECHGCFADCDIGYHCSEDECDFALDFKCALLPKSVTEREWDKHPLLLTFDASLDHPSDFFCEFCEREMHPKWWMYHCRQCDASFHLGCLRNASGYYRNMKFGVRYELGIHPNHPLTFTYITLKRHCDVCDEDEHVYTYPGLECASCYYVMCYSCGYRELEKNI